MAKRKKTAPVAADGSIEAVSDADSTGPEYVVLVYQPDADSPGYSPGIRPGSELEILPGLIKPYLEHGWREKGAK